MLLAALVGGGAACKQDIDERCEVTEDCANPEETFCTPFDRATQSGGICRPLSDRNMDAGVGTNSGVDAGPAGDAAEAGTEITAADSAADSVGSSDGSAEASDAAAGDAPATDVLPDLPAADLASGGG